MAQGSAAVIMTMRLQNISTVLKLKVHPCAGSSRLSFNITDIEVVLMLVSSEAAQLGLEVRVEQGAYVPSDLTTDPNQGRGRFLTRFGIPSIVTDGAAIGQPSTYTRVGRSEYDDFGAMITEDSTTRKRYCVEGTPRDSIRSVPES